MPRRALVACIVLVMAIGATSCGGGRAATHVVDSVITALNSDAMIAPNYWVDRKSGNNYYLTT